MESIRIDSAHSAWLRRVAAATGREPSAIVHAALDAYLPRLIVRPKLTARFTSGNPGLADEVEQLLLKGFGAHRM